MIEPGSASHVQDQAELLQALIDATQQSIWVVDLEHRLVVFNRVYASYFDTLYGRPLHIGDRPADFLPRELADTWTQYFHRACLGETFSVDESFEHPDGMRHFKSHFQPLRNAKQVITGCSVYAEDVSEFHRALKQVKDNERQMASILNNTDDIILSLDQDLRILHFNHGLSLLVEDRWSHPIRRGTKVVDILEPHYKEEQTALYKRGLAGEKFTQVEQYVDPDGKDVFIETSYNPVIDDDGHVSSLAVHSRDITLRKRAELELLAAKNRAEELSRMKSNFLANMSHEVRTPINGILGLAEIIAEETDINQIREYTRLLQQSGRRLLNTITSILDLSKFEAEGASLELHPVSLNQVVGEVVNLLRPLAETKGIYLIFMPLKKADQVLADDAVLSQVFNNVIGNAVKFTAKGGVSVVINTLAGTKPALSVKVSDTGVGMSAAFLPKVFDTFEQESSGQKRRYEGSGLGLSIAKRFLNLLGGDITVSSKKNVGTTFELTFPEYVPEPQP